MSDASFPDAEPSLALIEQLPLPIVIVDARGRILAANSVFTASVKVEAAAVRIAQAFAGSVQPGSLQLPARTQLGLKLTFEARAIAPTTWMLFEDRTESLGELQTRLAELERISTTDTLTGAWNRFHMDRMIDSEMARAQRYRQPLSLLMIDVDHFKLVNDEFGHAVGDSVLCTVVSRMTAALRIADTLYRWGGEEFTVLAPATNYEGAEILAERIRMAVAAGPIAEAKQVTVSIGVAEYLEHESRKDWFERADQAVYQAKLYGRNQVVVDVQGASTVWSGQDSAGSVLELVWRDNYDSGVAEIDDEHRELFRLANRAIARLFEVRPDHDALQADIQELVDHVALHFEHEEAILEKIGYPGLKGHRRAHQYLLQRAQELQEAIGNGSATLGELVQYLGQEVVSRHILTADRQFYPLLLARSVLASEPELAKVPLAR